MKAFGSVARFGKVASVLAIMAILGAAFQNCSESLPNEAQTVQASEGPSPLSIRAPSTNIASSSTLQLTGAGGIPPYRMAVITGSGTLDSSNLFTAPAVTETNIVEITDSKGSVSQITIEVLAPLVLNHNPTIALATERIKLIATGGKPPYTYELKAGVGTLTGDEFIPGNVSVATTLVQVKDSAGRVVEKSISVTMPARTALYKLVDLSYGGGPLLNTDPNAASAFGYVSQGIAFHLFTAQLTSNSLTITKCTIPVYGAYYTHYTTAACAAGYTNAGVAGYLSTVARPNTVPVYGNAALPGRLSLTAADLTSQGITATIMGYATP
jgi:hypothetical protein